MLIAKFVAVFRQIDNEFPRIEDFVLEYKVENIRETNIFSICP